MQVRADFKPDKWIMWLFEILLGSISVPVDANVNAAHCRNSELLP